MSTVGQDDALVGLLTMTDHVPDPDFDSTATKTLIAWQREVRTGEDRPLVDVDTALAVLNAARTSPPDVIKRKWWTRPLTWMVIVLAVIALIVLAGCATPSTASSFVGPAAAPTLTPTMTLTPHVDAPPIKYDPRYFPSDWATVRGECNTREIILERDAGDAAVDTDGDGCRDDGLILDLYTGNLITPVEAEIDHVVSKKDFWDSGGWRLTAADRKRFFNDQANLRAVTGTVNGSKGDRHPGNWGPSNPLGQCQYVTIYRDTKTNWHLTIAPAQAAGIDRMLATCEPASPR